MSRIALVEHYLDHVAVRVADRDAMRDVLIRALDWYVIEETDRFTLLGADADHGKLTLLDAEPGTVPKAMRLEAIVVAAPVGTLVDAPLELADGLRVTFSPVTDPSIPRHAVIGVSLRAQDPPIAAAMFEAEHGMVVEHVGPALAVLRVGEERGTGTLTLNRERWEPAAAPVLDHVGIRIADAESVRARAERDGLEVARWVEAAHSKAVFVIGPEGILIEYVELTSAFAS